MVRVYKITALITAVLVSFSLSSCILAPAIDSYKKLGLSKNDRAQLLGREVKGFINALQWGDQALAQRYVAQETDLETREAITKILEDEKVVDNKIISTNLSDDGYSAEVNVTIKSYMAPYYVVNDRKEVHSWRFGSTSGWKIYSRSVK